MLTDASVWIARLSQDGRFVGTATAVAGSKSDALEQVERRFPRCRVEGLRPQKDHDVRSGAKVAHCETGRPGQPTLFADAFEKALARKRNVVDKIK